MSNDTQDLQHELQPVSQAAQQLLAAAHQPIVDAEGYVVASDMLKAVKVKTRELDDREKAITKPINDSLKAIRDLFRAPKALLEQAETAFKQSMLSYQRAEEAKRQAAQRAAEELARKECERLAALAAKAEKRGDVEKAQQFSDRAAVIVAPVVEVSAPKVTGVATRKDYTFEIVDAALLPREYLVADEVKIRKVVRALGVNTNIPGVRVIEREILAVSSL